LPYNKGLSQKDVSSWQVVTSYQPPIAVHLHNLGLRRGLSGILIEDFALGERLFRRAILIGMLALVAPSAFAQEAGSNPAPVPPTFAEPPTVINMEEPQPGDHWAFETRDEITGKLTGPRTTTVTEVTPTEISVRFSVGGNDTGFSVYDRSWNEKSGGAWKYSPNDGLGIKSPLRNGASWSFKSEAVDAEHGAVWVRNGSSKVLVQEKTMTKAGLFDTFLIETTFSLRRTIDTSNGHTEITSRTWYAPAIDHWVRRTFVVRTDGHLRSSNILELVAYGRKD
jgi:hypothetical protein